MDLLLYITASCNKTGVWKILSLVISVRCSTYFSFTILFTRMIINNVVWVRVNQDNRSCTHSARSLCDMHGCAHLKSLKRKRKYSTSCWKNFVEFLLNFFGQSHVYRVGRQHDLGQMLLWDKSLRTSIDCFVLSSFQIIIIQLFQQETNTTEHALLHLFGIYPDQPATWDTRKLHLCTRKVKFC